MIYPSGYFRKKALTALRNHWQAALLVALIVNLPTLLMQGVSIFTGNDLADRFQALVTSASRDGILTEQLLLDETRSILVSTAFWTIRGLEILAWLITPCLSLGMFSWLLNRLRGQEDPVSAVFSRMRIFLKAIGLQLMIILKVLLWMLPGFAATILLMLPVVNAADQPSAAIAAEGAYGLMLPALLLMAVPAVMAGLRYAMAEYIMADRPESRIMYCIRRSKELMNGRKKNLFFLMASFLLWYLLEIVVTSLLTGVLAMLVQMLISLALSVYMSCAIGAFYLHLENGEKPEAEQAGENESRPETDELN